MSGQLHSPAALPSEKETLGGTHNLTGRGREKKKSLPLKEI